MDTSKIIKGAVSSGRYTVTAPIVKEDYGLYLQIEGVELPSTYEVDFSNSEHNGTSVTMIGNSDGVLIPRQFIDTGKDIFAFLYHVGANYGRTVYKFRIPNKLRPDRTNEEPTPEEQSVIDQAISALNEAVAQTAEDVASADQSAQSAKEDADRAEQAKEDASTFAQRSANSAQASADYSASAQASATASAQSASDAETARQQTTSLVAEAQGYADASEQSASTSTNSASQAQGYAQSASASANSASGYASQADISANTASAKASDASTSAQTASQKATESAQSASQALSYKTDAESAKTASQTAQGLAESARDSAITAKTDAESARDEAQNIVDGISAKAEQIDANTASVASLEEDRYKPYVVDSASGSIASFTDGADDLPLKSLVVDIDPVQDLSQGDPSPENICPISGWTGCNVNANGTVIPISWQTEAGTVYGCKLDVLSGLMTILTVKKIVTSFAGMFAIGTANNGNAFYKVFDNATHSVPASFYKLMVSNIFTYFRGSRGSAPLYSYGGNDGALATYMFILPKTITTVDDANAWLSNLDTPLEVTAFLATPITIQLTPREVNSLLGVNNIFADTGDCTVEYRADTRLYIERLTSPDSEDMIADANITSGQYFMVGTTLYKATANIANGGQIVVGTNCTRVSLAQALNEINS